MWIRPRGYEPVGAYTNEEGVVLIRPDVRPSVQVYSSKLILHAVLLPRSLEFEINVEDTLKTVVGDMHRPAVDD